MWGQKGNRVSRVPAAAFVAVAWGAYFWPFLALVDIDNEAAWLPLIGLTVIGAWTLGPWVGALGAVIVPLGHVFFLELYGRSPIDGYEPAAVSFRLVGLVALGVVLGRLRQLLSASAVQVAEREEALQLLEESEGRYRSLFEGVPAGLYRTTRDGKFLDVNAAFADILGYPREQLLDMHADVLYADDKARRRWLSDRGDAEIDVSEIEVRHRDGSSRHLRDASRFVRNESGAVEFIEGVVQDVTAAHRAESARQEVAALFQSAFSDAPIGMALASRDWRVEAVNSALCQMLLAPPYELIGLSVADFTHEADVERNRLMVDAVIDDGQPRQMEKRFIRRNGEEFWALLSVSPVTGAGDAYMLAHVIDITDQKKAELALRDLVESKDAFVASVSHELRTPMTVIQGLAYELRDASERFSIDETQELIELIADQSAEVAFLVQDLLVAARADIGTISVLPDRVSLVRQIERVVAGLPDFPGSIIDSDATAFVDPTRFRQIVRNLITNAVRYGGPVVTVSCSTHDGSACVEVSDNGNGIPEELRDRIFQPYERAHNAAGQPGSVGLGLTVARQLAELMGGSLSYTYVDGVSAFHLHLPLAEPISIPSRDQAVPA